jgi:hypothetical protein
MFKMSRMRLNRVGIALPGEAYQLIDRALIILTCRHIIMVIIINGEALFLEPLFYSLLPALQGPDPGQTRPVFFHIHPGKPLAISAEDII